MRSKPVARSIGVLPSWSSVAAPRTSVQGSEAALTAGTHPPRTSSSVETPGLGTQTDFIKLEASAAFDSRNNPSYPHSGGRYEVTAAKFNDRDLRQFDFSRVNVHMQQYIPLGTRYRVLALRAIGVFTQAETR